MWRQLIPEFTFYLGFSGRYFKRGYAEEQLGDEALIRKVDLFDIEALFKKIGMSLSGFVIPTHIFNRIY